MINIVFPLNKKSSRYNKCNLWMTISDVTSCNKYENYLHMAVTLYLYSLTIKEILNVCLSILVVPIALSELSA